MKHFNKLARWLIFSIIIVAGFSAKAVYNPISYYCYAIHDTLISPTEYEFDVYIKRDGNAFSPQFYLNNYQLTFSISNALGIENGGVLSASYIPGSSELPPSLVTKGVTMVSSGPYRYVRISGVDPNNKGFHIPGYLYYNTSVKIGRFRISNTKPYTACKKLDLRWWDCAPATQTYVYAIWPPDTVGTSYDVTWFPGSHALYLTNPKLNCSIDTVHVTGGGLYCHCDSYCHDFCGAQVCLDSSECGVVYQLIKNDTLTDIIKYGTGYPICFGYQTAGVYTVLAYRDGTYITKMMSGYAVVTEDDFTPTISGRNHVCVLSTDVKYYTQPDMTFYQWDVSSGGYITHNWGDSIAVNWVLTGPQWVAVRYKDIHHCFPKDYAVYPVTVNPLPVPTISGNNNLCQGIPVTYTTEAGKNNYIWNFSAGGIKVAGGTSHDNTITVLWNGSGSQWVSVNYTDGNGCTAQNPVTYEIYVNPQPVPEIDGNLHVCLGNDETYTTKCCRYNYIWNVSPGNHIIDGGDTNERDIRIKWNVSGDQWVSVYFTDKHGCISDTTQVEVIVNPAPVPTIIGFDEYCTGTAGTTYITQSGKTNYLWRVSPGGEITGDSTKYSLTVTWNQPGEQWVSVIYSDQLGCPAVDTAVFYVTILPERPTVYGNPIPCVGSATVYTSDPGNSQYSWSVSGGGTIVGGGGPNDYNITILWNTVGSHTVGVDYVPANIGCTYQKDTIYNVSVQPLPIPIISGNDTVCEDTPYQTYTTDPGMSNYVWNVAPGGIVISGGHTYDNTITIKWEDSGDYWLSVSYTNQNQCTSSSPTVFNVYVIPEPKPTISGFDSWCQESCCSGGALYITEAGKCNYVWHVSAGAHIKNGGGSSNDWITVIWTGYGPQWVSVDYTDCTTGCTNDSATVMNVIVYPVVPSIAGNNDACYNSTEVYTTEPGNTGYIWHVSAGGTIVGGGTPSDNTVTIHWTTTGSQSVSVEYTSVSGCTFDSVTTYNVTVHQLPVPVIACWGTRDLCQNTESTYSTEAGMTNYVWSVTGGIITQWGSPTDNKVKVLWTTPGTQLVKVSYTDGYGCTSATQTGYAVEVNRLAPTISGSDSVCLHSTVVYSTEIDQLNYAWVVSPGGTIIAGGGSTNNSVTVRWDNEGSQYVKVTYTDNVEHCASDTQTVLNVKVHPLPTPIISGNNMICASNLHNIYSTQSGMSNYVWTISAGGTITGGGGPTDNIVSVKWNTSGGNFVKVNFANEYGCTALTPTNYTVTVLAQPVPVISGLDSVCEGTTGVQYTTQAGMTNYQWHVSAGGTITSGGTYSDNKVTISWSTAGTQYVYVDYTDGNGCTAVNETVFPVRVLPLPMPTIFGNDYICAGTANVIYSTEYGKSNYVWHVSAGGTITAGGTSTDNTISITWNTPGSQTVSVNYTNGSGCVASTPTVYNVIVNPLPTPTISGNNNVCAGTTGVVYTTQAGMIDYIWQVSSGGTITSGGTLSDNTVTVTWNTAGPQTVKVNYKYPTGCDADSSTVYNVTVNPRPVPTVIGPSPVCLNSTGNGYTTESGMSNYIWSVSAGGTITAGGTSTNNNITITWKTAGLQTVSVNYTDGNGCTASTSTVNNVIVNSLPTPVITGPATACINSTGNVYSTTPGMSNYVWTGSAGAIITTGGTSTDNTITITWNTIGNHTVSVNYTDANGCTASSATVYDITVNPIPVADVTGPATACLNSAGNVYTATPGMTSYVWIVSAGGTIVAGGTTTDNTVTVRWDAVGPQSVSLNCTKGSCASTQPTVYAVTVNPRAVPVILGSPTACPGPSSDPLYSTDAGMSGYQWNISAGGTIISGGGVNNNSIEVEWNTLGTQWVKVNYTDGNGCNAANPVVYYIHVGSPTIDSGLVAYFPFNGNAKDMSGHGNDATVFGATLTKDRFGNENSAYSFNGVDNYMRILQSSSLRNLSTATFSYWVKYQVASGQIASTISNGPDHNTYNEDGFYTYAGSTGIQHNLGHWGGTIKTARVGYDALKALNYQSFTLVTIVIDSNYIRSYRNGVLQQTTQRAGLNISRTDLDWYLGQSGLNTYFMNGILDDIRIYNRAISDCEITELYDINKCEVVINSYRNSKLCANAPNLLVAGGCKTYSWSTGETKPDIQVIPTSVTTYTVTGTNGACTATSSLVVIPVSSHPDQGLALSLPIEGWVTDVSGNANKVVVYGGTQLVADRFGNPKSAIKLDGTSGYIRIAQSPSLNNLVNATFTYWLKYETTPGKVATTLTNGPDNVSERGFYNYAYENRITYTLGKYYDPANVTSTLPIDGSVKPNKEFSFVAVVIDDDSIRTYLDAKCMSSVARNGMPISRPSQDWLIGQSGSNTMFLNGTIDDIRIYNRALNSCEIVALRNYNKCGITMNGVPVTVCKGYPVTLTSSGGATYSWSTGKVGAVQTVHPTVTTKYFVTITQLTGCRAVDSYLVNVVNCNEEAENSVEGIKTVTSQDGTTSLNVYPNPFNDLSNISFTIPTDQKVVLNVYNLLGNKVAILMNEQKVAGSYVAEFNKNDLTPGVYFIEMKAGETTIQKRVVIL